MGKLVVTGPSSPTNPSRDVGGAELHAALFQQSCDAVVVEDSAGRCRDANPAACALLGYSRDALQGRKIKDLVAPGAEWAAGQHQVYPAQGSWRGDLMLRRGSGEFIAVDAVVTSVGVAEDTLRVAVLRDVTDRARAHAAAAAELRTSQDLYDQLFTGAPLALLIGGPDSTILRANPACCALLGYPEHELVGLALGDLTHPDDLAASLAVRGQLVAGALTSTGIDKRYVRADGSIVEASVTFTPMAQPDGTVNFAAVIQDVTQHRAAERALARERVLLQAVLEEVDAGVVACDADGAVTVVNRVAREILPGVTPGMPVAQLRNGVTCFTADGVTPLPVEEFPLSRALRGERVLGVEIVLVTDAGRWTLVCQGRPLTDGVGEQLGAVLSSHDVTNHRATQAMLVRQALHDPLTDLPNRVLLTDRLQQLLDRQQRDTDPFALLLLDLDDFKVINDSLGHAAGDQVLVALAARLRLVLRARDTVARLGGDEFAVLLDSTSREQALALAERVRETVSEPVAVGGQRVTTGASVGLVFGERGD